MRKPVKEGTFLKRMIKITSIVQLLTSIYLVGLALYYPFVLKYPTMWRVYVPILLFQGGSSLLLLRSLLKSALRRKAWFVLATTFFLGNLSFGSTPTTLFTINSSLAPQQFPMLISCLLLITATHSYIKEERTVWD